MTVGDEMKSKANASEMRVLSPEELDAASGAKDIVKIPLGGQVEVFFNKKTGAWGVDLGGKMQYFWPGDPRLF